MSSGTGTPGLLPLAEQLEELKQRSGRSYAALAHRTGLSRSTLHRYCQGATLPGTFGVVECVARVCGASEAELDRLYRAWRSAIAAQEQEQEQEQKQEGEAEPDLQDQAVAEEGGTPVPLRTYFLLRAAALLVAFVVTSTVTATSYVGGWADNVAAGTDAGTGSTAGGPESDEQQPEGPLWSVAPRPVDPEFFGQTLNTDTGEMPGFRTGAVRLWNSNTRWGGIERRRRHYDWTILDRMVKSAGRDGLPALFTFGGTPLWAAPDGRKSAFPDSMASPPDDLDDWDRFVEKVAQRYRDRIESYELWDYPSDRHHYAGSLTTLADMVERASRIIRQVDPGAVIACPSFGGLWTRQGLERLRKFARTGAYESCDVAALKLPPRRPDGRPEEIIELARTVHRIFYEDGIANIRLWNTGPDRDIGVAPPLEARRARDYAVRFYLAGLFSRPYGMTRMYFYSWGSRDLPLVVQPVGGPPTEAGRRMEGLMEWLDGAKIASCGRGAQMGLAEGAYTCRFERAGKPLDVLWTTRGRAEVTLEKGAYRLRHLDGRKAGVRAGERIGFDEEPVLIEHR
ncbi:MAG: helix-turn-helix domain-containing protein [Streptomyces sp.]|uniref:helix-turn-helix domain-containing protein n=1 Tax=Streptomyces sp. TaxID=1931 RepID=UPI003D6A75F8